jgi:signal transduction histidine kinase
LDYIEWAILKYGMPPKMNANHFSRFLTSRVRGNIARVAWTVLASVFVLLPLTVPGGQTNVLTNLGQVRALSLLDGKEGRPVKLQATVTYCDPEWRILFIQDETGWAYVERHLPTNDPLWKLHLGQLVDLEGITSPGIIQCNVNEQKLQVAGEGKLPVPVLLNSDESFEKAGDACWARAAGFISGLKTVGNRFAFDLQVRPNKALRMFVLNADATAAEALVGVAVEATGVLGLDLDTNHRPTGKHVILMMDLGGIKKIRPMPVTPISELSASPSNQRSNAPVRIRGNIVGQRTGKFLVVRDSSGSVQVNCDAPVSLADGSPVGIFAYPGNQGDVLVLNHAIVQAQDIAAEVRNTISQAAIPTAANTNLSELTRVIQVRNLSVSEAVRGHPVRVTGVLTYNDPVGSNQFIQDDSGGIFVALQRKKFEALPKVRQMVEILGFSGPGDYAPVIEAEQVRVLGESPFPRPKITTVQALMTGSEDSQWVTFSGVVRSQSLEGSNTVLSLSTGDAVVSVVVPDAAKQPAPKNYEDALVEIQGVCATIYDDQRRLRGIRLYVPTWEQIQVAEAPPADAFALPLRPISELPQFHAGAGGLHRSRIRGVLVLCLSDGSFYVQDATGGVLVRAQNPVPLVKTGETVELAGFPSVMNKLPVLQQAMIKPANPEPLPKLAHLSPESPLNESFQGTLVKFQGRILGHSSSTVQELLTVQFGQWITDAVLEKENLTDQLKAMVPGSVVSLTGVYAARLDDNYKIQSFQLLLRSPNDVTLISRPSFWTAQHTFWVIGTLGTVVALALGWVRLLRKQVQQQTRKLREEIEERKRMEAKVEGTHKELMVASRQAGMAEIATSVLHNVGNVLNSVNVSADLVTGQIRRSKVGNVGLLAALMVEHAGDLSNFLTRDTKGQQLPKYLTELANHLVIERELVVKELQSLTKNVEHIKDIVAMQQNYATVMSVTETVKITDLVEDAIRMNAGALERHNVQLVREYASELPEITVDKHKVLQILINLVRNAKYACDESNRTDKRITIRVVKTDNRIGISVIDNGMGILRENLTRIFNFGFTTRKNGHGFGLHSGALAAKEMMGSLVVHSDGPGTGAAFTLELPLPPNGAS